MSNQLSMDQVFINNINAIIEDHLEDDQFGVEELANILGISRSQLHRRLNAINGKSTSQFIREFRLGKAMEMLQDNAATASEIAYKVGFSSPSYFTTCFNQYYGYPPGEVKFRNPLKDEEKEEIHISNNKTETFYTRKTIFDQRKYVISILAILLIASFIWFDNSNSDTAITTENKNHATILENSIAVLPFKNMSGSPENEAFCDGMTAAIISRLSKIKGINKVISLTSMMNYKNNNEKSLTEISEELKVHYVLESGFQKSGNEIKINLQLIDGNLDKLIWSEVYEGQYDSIFKIQARVAEMVAKQLDADISDEELKGIRQNLTDNLEAYENYLQGVLIFGNNNSTNTLIASRKYFEKAIELDSTFTEAYLGLGRSYSLMGTWFGTISMKEAYSLATPYLKKALHFDPNNLELLAFLEEKEFLNWNFKAADSMSNILRSKRGDNFNTDFLNLTLGRYDQLTKRGDHILRENPNSGLYFPLVYAYFHKGQIDSVVDIMVNSLRLDPNSEPNYDHFGNIYLAIGDYKKAEEVLETGLLISDKRHASMLVHLAVVYHYLGDEEKSLELLNEVIDRANKGEPEINVFVAHYYARLGNNDEAFRWLDIAYKKHEVDMIWLKADPNLLQLKNDPRYRALCQKVGFPDIK